MAPKRPVSGLSTSLAATSSTAPSRVPGRGQLDRGHTGQGCHPAVQRTVRRRAQGPEQAGSTVVGATPPEPDHDPSGAGFERGQDQLTDPHGRGLLGALGTGEVHPARLGALDVGRAVDQQHARRDRITEGAGHGHRDQVAGERRGEDVHEAGTPVGHRREVDLVRRRPAQPACRDRLGCLDGGERAGELVGGDQDAHAVILTETPPESRWGRMRGPRLDRVTDLTIRPMRPDDVPAAERLSAEGFHELDTRMFRRSWPDPQLRPPERAAGWTARTLHFLHTDPGGCWVTEDHAGLAGVMTSYTREKCWFLATYAVRPEPAGAGHRQGAARRRAAPRAGVPARHARGVVRPESDPDLPPGGFRPASADVPHRDAGPHGDPGDREGARGLGERHRADGLDRPDAPAGPRTDRTTS